MLAQLEAQPEVKQYDRDDMAIVAVLVDFHDASRYVLVSVFAVTYTAVTSAVRYRYHQAQVEAWLEVGTEAQGIDAELSKVFHLEDAEKLYRHA